MGAGGRGERALLYDIPLYEAGEVRKGWASVHGHPWSMTPWRRPDRGPVVAAGVHEVGGRVPGAGVGVRVVVETLARAGRPGSRRPPALEGLAGRGRGGGAYGVGNRVRGRGTRRGGQPASQRGNVGPLGKISRPLRE